MAPPGDGAGFELLESGQAFGEKRFDSGAGGNPELRGGSCVRDHIVDP
jgi:hypothetical protein